MEHREYEVNFKKPKDGKEVETEIAYIKHTISGMDGDKYKGKIIATGSMVSLYIPEMGVSITVLKKDLQKVLEKDV